MTTDPLPQLVEQTFSTDDLSSSNLTDTNYWLSRLKSVVGVIPEYGGIAAGGIQLWHDYKLNSFFRKFAEYINGIKEIPVVERHKFVEEIQMKSHDNAGHVLLEMVDRLDNIQKEKALAQLSIARIHQFISIEDFFRLSTMLSRIPYVDLIELTNYKEPYYDEEGDTELLYATGALELHTLDANDSNKYILSRLGEKLLKWGFCIDLDVKRGYGTNVALDHIEPELIQDIMQQEIRNNRPRLVDETLIFPDGVKSGKLEDDEAYLYDLARGK